MKNVTGLVAAALLVPAAVLAQERPRVAAPAAPPQGGRGTYQIIAGAVESKITTGRPYSADTVTEMTQQLPDGNRIHRSSRTRTYRDSEGRTRREMYDDGGTLRSIAISDPVAKVSYTLDPQARAAYKTGGGLVMPSIVSPGGYARGGRGSGTGGAVARPSTDPPPTQAVAPVTRGAGGRGGGRGAVVRERTPGPDNPNVKKEDLGTQNIEGVMATGMRTTTIIPAGEIGNVQEIRIVSEQWFSDELQLLVMTKHSDPRSGENTYRLTNILRAEPDPTLFTVPADYTIQERGIRKPQ